MFPTHALECPAEGPGSVKFIDQMPDERKYSHALISHGGYSENPVYNELAHDLVTNGAKPFIRSA